MKYFILVYLSLIFSSNCYSADKFTKLISINYELNNDSLILTTIHLLYNSSSDTVYYPLNYWDQSSIGEYVISESEFWYEYRDDYEINFYSQLEDEISQLIAIPPHRYFQIIKKNKILLDGNKRLSLKYDNFLFINKDVYTNMISDKGAAKYSFLKYVDGYSIVNDIYHVEFNIIINLKNKNNNVINYVLKKNKHEDK